MSEEQEQYIVKTQEERIKDVATKGLHIVTVELMDKVDSFFETYDENMTKEEMKKRYGGMYGKIPNEPIKKSRLVKMFDEFIQTERRDFILKHNTISMDNIVDIGIDKFAMTLGWTKASDVGGWRKNVVRIGACPDCNDQFIPLMFQTNQGLCNNCRPNISVKAIRRFIEYVAATNERYIKAESDLLMDFYIMFYSDRDFRKLFTKGSESAVEMETREFVTPEWFKEAQEKQANRLQQNLIESVEEK